MFPQPHQGGPLLFESVPAAPLAYTFISEIKSAIYGQSANRVTSTAVWMNWRNLRFDSL